MKKIALIHDFLVERGLVADHQLEVWTDEITVLSSVRHPAHTELGQTYQAQINIVIKQWSEQQDIRAVTLALAWWLNLYEPQQQDGTPRLKVLPYLEGRRITEVWIGLKVEETSRLLADGTLHSCLEPDDSWETYYEVPPKIIMRNVTTGDTIILHPGAGDD